MEKEVEVENPDKEVTADIAMNTAKEMETAKEVEVKYKVAADNKVTTDKKVTADKVVKVKEVLQIKRKVMSHLICQGLTSGCRDEWSCIGLY